jgi:bacterioferritin-associated ferredoxin
LNVTEEAILAAVAAFDLATLKQLREHTGAGDGCTACHKRLRGYLERRVALPVLRAS